MTNHPNRSLKARARHVLQGLLLAAAEAKHDGATGWTYLPVQPADLDAARELLAALGGVDPARHPRTGG